MGQNFSSVPWKIQYAKWRLWYQVNLTQNATDVYIYFEVPTSVLDNIIKYCRDHNYTVCDIAWPRVYYYDQTSGQQIQMENVTYLSGYSEYNAPYNFTVYFSYLPNGTHYFVIYYPWYFWEDFEDNERSTLSSVGQCFKDGWCVVAYFNNGYYYTYAQIVSSGFDPTPVQRLYLNSGICNGCYIVLRRSVNMSVNPNNLFLIAEWNWTVSNNYWIGFEFLLTNGSNTTIYYGSGYYYVPAGVNVCKMVNIGSGYIKVDLLRDLSCSCNIYLQNVSKLLNIYLGVKDYYYLYIDNIKVVPWDIINYYP